MAPSILATVDAALVTVSLDECRCMAKAALAAQSAAAAREQARLLVPRLPTFARSVGEGVLAER